MSAADGHYFGKYGLQLGRIALLLQYAAAGEQDELQHQLGKTVDAVSKRAMDELTSYNLSFSKLPAIRKIWKEVFGAHRKTRKSC